MFKKANDVRFNLAWYNMFKKHDYYYLLENFILELNSIYEVKKDSFDKTIPFMFNKKTMDEVYEECKDYLRNREIIPCLAYLTKSNHMPISSDELDFEITSISDLFSAFTCISDNNQIKTYNLYINIKNNEITEHDKKVLLLYPNTKLREYVESLNEITDESITKLIDIHPFVKDNVELYIRFYPEFEIKTKFYISVLRDCGLSVFKFLLDNKFNISWDWKKDYRQKANFYISLISEKNDFINKSLCALFIGSLMMSKTNVVPEVCLVDNPDLFAFNSFNSFSKDKILPMVELELRSASHILLKLDELISRTEGIPRLEKVTSFSTNYEILKLINYNTTIGNRCYKYKQYINENSEYSLNIRKQLSKYSVLDYIYIYDCFIDSNNNIPFNFSNKIAGYNVIRTNWIMGGHRYDHNINYISIPLDENNYDAEVLYEKRYMFGKCFFQKTFEAVDEYEFRRYIADVCNNTNI